MVVDLVANDLARVHERIAGRFYACRAACPGAEVLN
jgi:hypothetical protein